MFIGGLRLDIVKGMIIRDNLPKTFLKAFGQALRFEAMRQYMVRDKELLEESTPLAQV